MKKTLIDSAKKTSRVIVLDEGYGRYGGDRRTCRRHCGRRILRSGRSGKAKWAPMHVPISVFSAAGRWTVPDGAKRYYDAARRMCKAA